MQAEPIGVSNGALWAARIISGLVALFLLLDGAMKLVKPAFVVEETMRLGYPERVIVPIGIVLISAALSPRTFARASQCFQLSLRLSSVFIPFSSI